MNSLYFFALAAGVAGAASHALFVTLQYRCMKTLLAGQSGAAATSRAHLLEYASYLAWALALGLLLVHQGALVLTALAAGSVLGLMFTGRHSAGAAPLLRLLERLLPAQLGCVAFALLYTGAFTLPAVAAWPWLVLVTVLSHMTAGHTREVQALVGARNLPTV